MISPNVQHDVSLVSTFSDLERSSSRLFIFQTFMALNGLIEIHTWGVVAPSNVNPPTNVKRP